MGIFNRYLYVFTYMKKKKHLRRFFQLAVINRQTKQKINNGQKLNVSEDLRVSLEIIEI